VYHISNFVDITDTYLMDFRTVIVVVDLALRFCHGDSLNSENPLNTSLLKLIWNREEMFHVNCIWLDGISLGEI